VLAVELEALFNERKEKRRESQGRAIMEPLVKRGNSFEKVIHFLDPGGQN
jgi:hypothetical protein